MVKQQTNQQMKKKTLDVSGMGLSICFLYEEQYCQTTQKQAAEKSPALLHRNP